MRSFLQILSALATASTAVALPATNEQPAIPNLPEGFFAGYNNPDGTSTLQFIDTHENFTFTPREASEPASLDKRDGWTDCWPGKLNRDGVDAGMTEMRTRLSHTPIGLGQNQDWPPYFGYNNNGVYVYFCVNSGGLFQFHSFTREDLDWFSYHMDQQCGAYVPGYIRREDVEWMVFGKAQSGTRLCQGNPRSNP